MSQSCLLIGGTKVLERTVQMAMDAAPVVLATVEEGLALAKQKPEAIVILGPTLKRALAAVAQFRAEGQTVPRIVVVFRDEQREDVKRQQRGKVVADRYIAQSQAQKQLEPALKELAAQAVPQQEATIEADELIEEVDAADLLDSGQPTELLDVVTLPPEAIEVLDADEEPTVDLLGDDLEEELTVTEVNAPRPTQEVLGALDVTQLDEMGGEEVVETLGQESMEELEMDVELEDDGEGLETIEPMEVSAEEDVEEELDMEALEPDEEPMPEVKPTIVQPLETAMNEAAQAAARAEIAGYAQKLEIANQLATQLEHQNAELHEKIGSQSAEIAALHAQLKAVRGQMAALQTRMVDCRIQADEAAGIVRALAQKLG